LNRRKKFEKKVKYLDTGWLDYKWDKVKEMLDLLESSESGLTAEEISGKLGLGSTKDERLQAKRTWAYIPGVSYLIELARLSGYRIIVTAERPSRVVWDEVR